jgi:hypothetical protein
MNTKNVNSNIRKNLTEASKQTKHNLPEAQEPISSRLENVASSQLEIPYILVADFHVLDFVVHLE